MAGAGAPEGWLAFLLRFVTLAPLPRVILGLPLDLVDRYRRRRIEFDTDEGGDRADCRLRLVNDILVPQLQRGDAQLRA